jgi:hypothetical protein
MKKIGFLLIFLVLTLISGCSNNKLIYAENDDWARIESSIEPDVEVEGELVSQTGCILKYTVTGNENRRIGADYAIYRRKDGEWKLMEKKHTVSYGLDASGTVMPEETKNVYIDWSYEYGRLPGGTYKLVTQWHDRWNRNSFTVGWIYELPVKGKLPGKPYGYTGIDTAGVKLNARKISDYLWELEAEGASAEEWSLDFSYALYKMEAGKWEEIEQEAKLSPVFDAPHIILNAGSEFKWHVCLASVYPCLKPGTYRFVKRMLKTADPNIKESWSTLATESLSYISAEFTIEKKLTWKSFEADPLYWNGYNPYKPVSADVEFSTENITPDGCDIIINNISKLPYNMYFYYQLWRYEKGHWLPLAQKRIVSYVMTEWTVLPGKTATQKVIWNMRYGSLEPGLYRLVAESSTYSEGQQYAVFEFKVNKES